jgi:[NiFe] hydrogenase assembly HybE family chaperone
MSDAPAAVGESQARLVAVFRAAAQRMHGLGLVNPALTVEAVAFGPWEDRWLGVMVTPWFMNLALLPRNPGETPPLKVGAKRQYAFPAGVFEFIGASDPAVGDFEMCSLFSPMDEFADQATARLVATLAREALFDDANAEPSAIPPPGFGPASSGEATSRPLAELEQRAAAPMSKRDFLRGRVRSGDRDPSAPQDAAAKLQDEPRG